MPGLEDFAAAKLSTRETVIREVKDAVAEQLYSGWGQQSGRVLDGPLGEQIAFAAGSLNLTSFVTPEQIAEGICKWLDTYFLQSPRKDGPREGPEDASPPPCSKSADGSRAGAPNHVEGSAA